MSLDLLVKTINELLAHEKSIPVNSVTDLIAHQQRRSILNQYLSELKEVTRKLQEEIRALPPLAPLSLIRWAQTVEAMPNLVFLELDTTGLSSDAEIIHALVLDGAGTPLLSMYALPSRPVSNETTRFTSITNELLAQEGVPVAFLIERLRETLHSKYVLSYNLDFDVTKIGETTRRVAQEEITLVGEDLMVRAMRYFHIPSYPKLETLCKRIGSPLPGYPHQTALHRIQGQRALLHALATGFTDQSTQPLKAFGEAFHEEEDEGLDEQPF